MTNNFHIFSEENLPVIKTTAGEVITTNIFLYEFALAYDRYSLTESGPTANFNTYNKGILQINKGILQMVYCLAEDTTNAPLLESQEEFSYRMKQSLSNLYEAQYSIFMETIKVYDAYIEFFHKKIS